MKVKRRLALALAALVLMGTTPILAEQPATQQGEQPPEKPEGDMEQGGDGQTPPDMPEGGMGPGGDGEQPPEKPEGDMGPGGDGQTPPDGGMGGPGGGGQSAAPSSYDAVMTVDEDASVSGEIVSEGTDENALLITGGTVSVTDASISRVSSDSTGGDNSSFYGVGAAILTTSGIADIANSTITTDAAGGAGVFAYGTGLVYVSDTVITTQQNTSGGIHVAGGGTLYAKDLTVTTQGESSAAIRSDRGGGTLVADGGSYTSNGTGSPAVYVTADITCNECELTANTSEALCLEGRNDVRLYDCDLTGNMLDLETNDNTWTVILYQSMSGDAEVGKGSFEMVGGSLTSTNGGLFYTTNTSSEFVLSEVEITAAEDCEYFLRCTGNANQRGWGTTGANGAECVFTGITQEMNGDVIWDSISTLDMYLLSGSVLRGAFVDDESCAGEGGDGSAALSIDASSCWIVTGDSVLTTLNCEGTVRDAEGKSVTIKAADGTVYAEGESEYTVTVVNYSETCDTANAGTAGSFENYEIDF